MNSFDSKRTPALRWSIGVKLTIIFLTLAILPMAGTAYYNLTMNQGEVAKVAEENLLVLSRSIASEINQLLVENLRTSATLAGEPLVVQYLASSDEERADLEPSIYQTLQNFADTHPDFDAPGLIDANGVAVAVHGVPQAVGLNFSDRDYFVAVEEKTPYISDVLVGRTTGVPGIFFAHPATTEEGKVVGMSNMRLNVDFNIWEIIDDVSVGQEGIAYLVDQDGVIIAHPNRELLYHSLGELTPEAKEAIKSGGRFGTVDGTEEGAPLIPESLGLEDLAVQLASGQESGSYHYHSPLDQRDHIAGYTRLEKENWTVVVDLPQAQFLAPLQRLATVTWISVGVVGVVTLIVSILLGRGITRPIRTLGEAAIAVENDQPFEPADIEDVTSGHDEIAHLGRVFSNMVMALRRRVSELHTVYEIGQDITATLEVDETLQAILDQVHNVIAYDAAEITLFDEQKEKLIVTAWSGKDDFENTYGNSYQLGHGFTGAIGAEQQSAIISDIQAQAERQAVAEHLTEDVSIRSLLGVPLLIRDRLVGTLELVNSQTDAFDENDQRLLETIAPQAAIAIEKAQQIREREQMLQQQIKQLRIEIDHTKRERQVSAITETDYFQQLAQQATEMRQQAKSEEDTSSQ